MEINASELIYRKLNGNDTDIFIKLRFDFLSESYNDFDQEDRSNLVDSLKSYFNKHIMDNEFIGMICEYNGNVISIAYLTISERPANHNAVNGKTGTLLNVYTYPEYRKKGISTNIVRMIVDEAKKENVSIIELLATKDGEGIYKKIGFNESVNKSMKLKL